MFIGLYLMTAQCEVQDFIWLVTLPVVDIVEHEYNWTELNWIELNWIYEHKLLLFAKMQRGKNL
jgi:hypothetical protein